MSVGSCLTRGLVSYWDPRGQIQVVGARPPSCGPSLHHGLRAQPLPGTGVGVQRRSDRHLTPK